MRIWHRMLCMEPSSLIPKQTTPDGMLPLCGKPERHGLCLILGICTRGTRPALGQDESRTENTRIPMRLTGQIQASPPDLGHLSLRQRRRPDSLRQACLREEARVNARASPRTRSAPTGSTLSSGATDEGSPILPRFPRVNEDALSSGRLYRGDSGRTLSTSPPCAWGSRHDVLLNQGRHRSIPTCVCENTTPGFGGRRVSGVRGTAIRRG